MEWQPIETAPKNGPTDRIMLHTTTRLFLTAYDCFFDKADGVWMSRYRYIDERRLRCTRFDIFPDPTHWMPTPTHPKEKP